MNLDLVDRVKFSRDLLAGVPGNRLADLYARAKAGTLTAAEQLALAVLTGGRTGEECVPGFLDACMAEYSHGSYRVPVRVIADPKRIIVALHLPKQVSGAEVQRLTEEMKRHALMWQKGGGCVFVVDGGAKLEIYEVASSAEAGVEVRSGG